jgi:hypothetical protein
LERDGGGEGREDYQLELIRIAVGGEKAGRAWLVRLRSPSHLMMRGEERDKSSFEKLSLKPPSAE